MSIVCVQELIPSDKGESEGYTVKSKEEQFPISNYPLEESDFFYSQKQGIASSKFEPQIAFSIAIFKLCLPTAS